MEHIGLPIILQAVLSALLIVHLKIYDMAGREIAVLINGEKMNAGYYTKMFNGVSLSSGTYFYVVQADGQMISKRMVLVK